MKSNFPLTKIIATLGPVSSSEDTITNLIKEGVRVFRINFSHGKFEDYEQLLKNIRLASEQCGIKVAILGDLPGPKIRVGMVQEEGVLLVPGQKVEFCKEDLFTEQQNESLPIIFSTTYPAFIDEVAPGERVLLDDGNVFLECLGKEVKGDDERLICKVIDGGLITSRKGINLPDTDLTVPALTEKDHACISFAVKNNFDYLALSFVRKAEDVIELREKLESLGARDKIVDSYYCGNIMDTLPQEKFVSYIPIITKIEKPQAIDNLEEIIKLTDCVMIARGDLGVEMDLAEVAVLQKRIIDMCHEWGVPVVVATQMLQSMIDSPVPTRAEVSDVANAIFDGADAVMLSGETAVGKWPVEAVKMMTRIAAKSNDYLVTRGLERSSLSRIKEAGHRNAALAHGVKTIVKDMDVKYIVIWSKLGGGPKFLSQYRIPVPIIVFGSNETMLRLMALLFGLIPLSMKQPESSTQFISSVDKFLQENNYASKGDAVVFAMGEPINRVGVTNSIIIHRIGEVKA